MKVIKFLSIFFLILQGSVIADPFKNTKILHIVDQLSSFYQEIDAGELSLFESKYSEQLYKKALESWGTRFAYLHAWVPVLEQLHENQETMRFLEKLTKYEWVSPGLAPSLGKSAWIVLSSRACKSCNISEFLKKYSQTEVSDCSHGYIYALGLLAEVGNQDARDILISRLNFEGESDIDCAILAARGLLVIAHQGEDEIALNALSQFQDHYNQYQRSR